MKKTLILVVLLVCVSLVVSAQGFYFDIGLGAGKGWTTVNGFEVTHIGTNDIAVEVGLKAGFKPFRALNLFFVGDVMGIGHRFFYGYGNIFDGDNIQLNSFLLGGGVIFYPFSLLQLGASIGYSLTANLPNTWSYPYYDSKGGYAWSVSAAVDLGKGGTGFLIGAKYIVTNNTLEVTEAKQKTTALCVFARFAVRNK
ncbi:MAG: hypothetical protein FWD26_10910 [Treponema sp.]|nr:hypothetical protein [Treponema sp.]